MQNYRALKEGEERKDFTIYLQICKRYIEEPCVSKT